MATVTAWVTSVTVGPCRPSAATTTCTSSPATATASRRIRTEAIERLARSRREQADDDVGEQEAEGDGERDPVGEEVGRRLRPRERAGRRGRR